mgnify:CR=1 FL=1
MPTPRQGTISDRVIAPIRSVVIGNLSSSSDCVNEIRTELDNHADTCVVSDDTALVIHDFDQPVNVHGYNESVGATKVQDCVCCCSL